jgi:hypothetical protein
MGEMTMLFEPDAKPMQPDDLAALRQAARSLEQTTWAGRLANLAGRQIELAGHLVPERAAQLVSSATQTALQVTMRAALMTLRTRYAPAAPRFHKTLVAASGAAGGAFGLLSLPIELPISTTIMLRSIAEIARAEGEDLSQPEAALNLLEVFALGARQSGQDLSESGYFAVRAVLARTVTEAARYIFEKSAVDEAAPVLVRLIASIAGRFGMVVSQKLAAQSIPVIGAVGGAAVNLAFMDHFQDVARGHFTIRRLERAYGVDAVRQEYERVRQSQ